MKKSLLAGIALAALVAAPAIAADLGVRKAPVYKAPPAPAVSVYNWTGCYIGVEGGGAWGRSRQDNTSQNATITGDFNVSGGVVGGTIGCNYQVSNVVFGIENDLSWSSKKGSVNDLLPFNTTYTSETHEKWIDTVRGRIGLAFDKWLIYATGGGAFASIGITICDGTCGTEDQTRTGWTAGGGVEVAVWDNLTAKAEYLYADFGSKSYFTPPPSPFVDRTAGVKLNDQLFRVGLNYRFGPVAAPVAAKY